MISRVQELCRALKPVLGQRIDRLYRVYLSESDPAGRADVEQTLELLAARHLGRSYEPDRSPFPPAPKRVCQAGDIPLGKVDYSGRTLYPFNLKSARLKEHVLVAGRSGSGKTNLTFVLVDGIMKQGIKILALDWKRGYRDLLSRHKQLRIYTIGRDIAPFRFNPLIPPPGCEPTVWIKLIVDVIASAYLGGEGVISLLVAGLDHLYRQAGVFDHSISRWPTILDMLAWLRTVKLKGRAAMWQASAERILVGMTYGEFGAVLNTQDNSHIADLLNHNVILEMDGLSSSSDKTLFSEALTLYLYRYRLAQGPQERLTNMIVLEEAHNLLLKKSSDTRESVLETSIRMIRQYGIGYVFVDQSASLLSKVAFANSYATIALSQKLRSDIQALAGAMNLTDEQKQALSTLPIGTAVLRLADEYPEPFMVKIPRYPIREGAIKDSFVQKGYRSYSTDSMAHNDSTKNPERITPIPGSDKNKSNVSGKTENNDISHPPSPKRSSSEENTPADLNPKPPYKKVTLDTKRFLQDIIARPLSTTVSRYQKLHLSRRRGNAIRVQLTQADLIKPIPIATRTGQIILAELTPVGREFCTSQGIDPGPNPREGLEHCYWVQVAKRQYEKQGYRVTPEYSVNNQGFIDLLAERPGNRIAIEIETSKSDIKRNIEKLKNTDINRILLLATNPESVTTCTKIIGSRHDVDHIPIELKTWLDFS